MKWRENWSKLNFGFFGRPPHQQNRIPLTNVRSKLKKKTKLFKIAWNGENIDRKWLLDFLAPPPKKSRLPQKNQSCSKLNEIYFGYPIFLSGGVKNYFKLIFSPFHAIFNNSFFFILDKFCIKNIWHCLAFFGTI